MEFVKNDGGRSNYFPSKLKKDRTTDCVLRAIATATNTDYLEVMKELFKIGLEVGQMPNNEKCYSIYLESKGWKKQKPFRNAQNRKFKVLDAPFKHDEVYIIHTTRHLTVVKNNQLHDTWNCSSWCANSYYVKTK